jgi:hypothetical protein
MHTGEGGGRGVRSEKWSHKNAIKLSNSHSRNIRQTRANLARRMSIFSKKGLANVANLANVKLQHFGEFMQIWRIRPIFNLGCFMYKKIYF